MNPYQPFSSPPPPLLARRALAAKVLQTIRRNNVSVVGRPHYGKSVLLAHVAAEARKAGTFTDVVVWDLRHFTPEEDSAFFRRFAEMLAAQLTAFGTQPQDFFASDSDRTAASISEFLSWLQENKSTLLLVMDGIDGPLSCSGLSKNVWDNLCAFAEKGSLRLLAGSRRRLRELCQNPESRTSDFFHRFDDPPTTLGAFSDGELEEFLEPIATQATIEKGAYTEFRRQSGGVPVLSAALARKLYDTNSEVSPLAVREGAAALLSERSETVPLAWDTATVDEQAAYAELAKESMLRGSSGRLADELVRIGFAERSGGTLRASCELVLRYSENQHANLRSVRSLFEGADDYSRNIREVVQWRYRQLEIANEELRDFTASAVENLGKPKSCLKDLRSVTEQGLELVWRVEAPDRQIPKYQNSHLSREHGPLPSDSANLIKHLNWLTDPRNGVTPKKVNRQIYCLLNALKGFSDLGQHQGGIEIDPTFAATACTTAVELASELAAAGLDAA